MSYYEPYYSSKHLFAEDAAERRRPDALVSVLKMAASHVKTEKPCKMFLKTAEA